MVLSADRPAQSWSRGVTAVPATRPDPSAPLAVLEPWIAERLHPLSDYDPVAHQMRSDFDLNPHLTPLMADDVLISAAVLIIDPSFIVTHERPLSEGPDLYTTFRNKADGCIKVMMRP